MKSDQEAPREALPGMFAGVKMLLERFRDHDRPLFVCRVAVR